MPERLNRIRWAIYDYFFCTGQGFHFDPEMIYSMEDDYSAFLRNVITSIQGLDTSQLRAVVDGSTVTIRILTDEYTYYRVFEQGGDYLHFDVVDPIVHALAKKGSETLLYSPEYLLVVEQQHKDLVKQYTSTDFDGEEEYQKTIRNRIYNYLYYGVGDSLDRVMKDLKTHSSEAVAVVFAANEHSWRDELWIDDEDVAELKTTLSEEIPELDLA